MRTQINQVMLEMDKYLLNLVPGLRRVDSALHWFVADQGEQQVDQVVRPLCFLAGLRPWEQRVRVLHEQGPQFEVEVDRLLVSESLQHLVELSRGDWPRIEDLGNSIVEHVVKPRTRLLRLQLGHRPLQLAEVLELIEMEVFKGGVFDGNPDLLVAEVCFESHEIGKFDNSIEVKFASAFNDGISPHLVFFSLRIAFPSLVIFE